MARVVKNLQASVAGQALPGQVGLPCGERLFHRRQRRNLRAGGVFLHFLPVNLGIGGGVQSGYLYAAQNGL